MREIRLRRHPEVYEPAEDTFLLADNLDVREKDAVLEVGVGSGYVSLIAAEKAETVVGIDINPHAVRLAKSNAKLNGIRNVDFIVGDLFSPLSGRFDLVVMNPPYLPEEKVHTGYLERSWNGGGDGRAVTDRFIDEVDHYLKRGGRVEIVQSSISGCDETIRRLCESGFKTRIVAECRLFFERIVLIKAMKPDGCSCS
ncbi:methyltransferase [Candidatus Bathyarchaeota archaeon]|nr:methyltransferase [Candidatus Bathyarchaeota archaeon]